MLILYARVEIKMELLNIADNIFVSKYRPLFKSTNEEEGQN